MHFFQIGHRKIGDPKNVLKRVLFAFSNLYLFLKIMLPQIVYVLNLVITSLKNVASLRQQTDNMHASMRKNMTKFVNIKKVFCVKITNLLRKSFRDLGMFCESKVSYGRSNILAKGGGLLIKLFMTISWLERKVWLLQLVYHVLF